MLFHVLKRVFPIWQPHKSGKKMCNFDSKRVQFSLGNSLQANLTDSYEISDEMRCAILLKESKGLIKELSLRESDRFL